MKKLLSLLLTICIVFICIGMAAEASDKKATAIIPDYQIIIDDSLVYYADSLYPFLNYKGITYLPMTYEYARAMNLTTGYLEGSAFMVAYNPCDDKLPVYETTVNSMNNTVIIPQGYNVYVNGKKAVNDNAGYPLLNFRGVTYFPLVWEYAVDEFGWKISFDGGAFKINTENNTADRWSLVEKRENDAVMKLYYSKDIPLSDGSIQHDYITEYHSLDYKTGSLELLEDYVPADEYFPLNTKLEITVKDGDVYYKEQNLGKHIDMAESDYEKPADVASMSFSVNAFVTERHNPLKVVELDIRTETWKTDGSGSGTRMTYTYLLVDDKLVYVGNFVTVENAFTLGEDIYFNTVEYGQTISRHYLQNNKMWRLSNDGTLTEISYADYNSIKIIGKANDVLYLKCLWSPENHMDYAPYSVSLVNDGYYTFDGQGIKFVSPYVYSDFDVVSSDGDILAVNNVLDKITRCELNPEYY